MATGNAMTDKPRHMVVGLDGSPGAEAALAWAAAHVDRFGPIQPVSAWHYPWWSVAPLSPGSLLPPPESTFVDDVSRMMERMLESVDHDDRLDPEIVHGQAGSSLVDAAGKATLLVVGTRGHGELADGLLGSVSRYCVNAAPCPVAVVPAHAGTRDATDRVVVGIEAATASSTVEWALANTPDTVEIELIHAWDPDKSTVTQVAALAEAKLDELATALVDQTIQTFDQPVDRLHGTARRGDAREVLRSASSDADLLILGAKDHPGLAHGRFGGSVTNAVTHKPSTTIVIVR